MNKTDQFWALLKFQFTLDLFRWVLSFFVCIFLTSLNLYGNSYPPDLEDFFLITGGFFGAALIVILTAPEKILSSQSGSEMGTEFLLTRAIDRPVLYRAKSALFYPIVLILLLWTIFLPRGNAWVAEWQLGTFVMTAITFQILMVLLYPFKYVNFFFWPLFFGTGVVLLVMTMVTIAIGARPFSEKHFFSFAAHQIFFGILTALAFVFSQLWCERRFARLEQ